MGDGSHETLVHERGRVPGESASMGIEKSLAPEGPFASTRVNYEGIWARFARAQDLAFIGRGR
jgi:hypothetical protein